ncbi:hypothetical protein FRD01_17395 [Microvenator marinus]|uniref:Peptidase M50 domain-containing protein n=1 Tax=Microvenator marinus TaxID=2600177 RepID=A0A5B8XUR0_9DELT|nr:site-2 protease family protein [Microvenator marinus]QED28981.1 hypothetical protein FRD01_17395 [Microvenator marinus]
MFYDPSGWKVGSLAGVDISISFGYIFLLMFYIVMNGVRAGILFAAAVTLSLLIHEMGHAVVAKYYKLRPSVLLHGFGGLCFHDVAKSDRDDALIVLAGPIIEIIFGALAFALLAVVPLTGALNQFVYLFGFVSIFWGAINLFLPLWPLDGGKLLNLIMRRFTNDARAQDLSLKVSVTVAIPIGVLALINGQFFITLLIFFIILDNINTLKSGADIVGRRSTPKVSSFAKELLANAEKALEEGDFREAYRTCHQIRSNGDVLSDSMQTRIWEILALTAYQLEEYEEAEGWLKRAPNSSALKEVRLQLESRA